MPNTRPVRRAVTLIVAFLLAAMLPGALTAAPAGTTERISVGTGGIEANDQSGNGVGQAALSADGRFVVFTSYASNLVPGDVNGTTDVFIRDRASGTTRLVSGGVAPGQYSGSTYGGVSADGRYVVFASTDASLDTSSPGGIYDTYIRDLVAGTTTRLSRAADGGAASDNATPAAMTPDGRYVLLVSGASNLVATDTNGGQSDVFLIDRQAGTTTLVSYGPNGSQGDLGMYAASISDDGRYIGMASSSTNLGVDNVVPCPNPPFCPSPHLMAYVRDLQTGVTTLISQDATGTPGDANSGIPMISGDGNFAAFWSTSTNLGAAPGGTPTVLVADLATGAIESLGVKISNIPTISHDGRYVTYDGNGAIVGAFVHDRLLGTNTRIDVKTDGTDPDAGGFSPAISADASVVTFGSYASDLVPDDGNGVPDVFAHQLVTTVYSTEPGAPTGVTAAAGDGSASVSWLPPASDGGSPITGYTVTAAPGGATVSAGAAATDTTVGGLTNGIAYTFKVSAVNGVGPSADSVASAPVTPQAGAPAPQTASESIPPGSGGTATTDPGSGPTAADPITTSVTVPATPSGGSVTVAETAVTVTPPAGGYQFLGQQIDITSSAATSAVNPLTIVFTVDESVIRAAFGLAPGAPLPAASSVDITRAEGAGGPAVVLPCTSIGGGGTAIAPDPCIADRTYVNGGTDLRVTVLTGSASHWNTTIRPTVVTVGDAAYAPKAVVVTPGGVVRWSFSNTKPQSVTDTLKLGPGKTALFDSGPRTSGAFGVTFSAAGAYSYGSTAPKGKGLIGTVTVPMTAKPATGGVATPFTITWSSRSITGYVFDVEARFLKAGSKKWTAWTKFQDGTTAPSITSAPTLGAGTYAFHSRLRNKASGIVSGWSPDLSVVVH